MLKNKIKGWFKKLKKTENIEKGKDLIEKELKKNRCNTQIYLKLNIFNQCLINTDTKT